MRPILLAALVAASLGAWGQGRSGTYRPAGGSPTSWSINPHNSLVWGGNPYLPVGIRMSGSEAEIDEGRKHGIGDALVEVPAGGDWSGPVGRLEAAGLRYLLCVSSMAPSAKGFSVEPASYRIPGITSPRKIDVRIDATTALAVLITKHDQMIERVTRIAITGGRLVLDVKPLNDLEHVLLIYPDAQGTAQPDYWEGFDTHRDRVLRSLRDAKLGAGLRGIVNPMGTLLPSNAVPTGFVPTSSAFQAEFAAFIERKYRSTATLEKAWLIGAPDLGSFAEYSRLVPLWWGARGVLHLWDPKTDRLYPIESRRSTVWPDIQATIQAATNRRYLRLVQAIRKLADVPVIQDWSGWAAPSEGSSVVDGLGMRIDSATPSGLANQASRVTSSLLRRSSPGWLAATDIDLARLEDPGSVLPGVLQDLASLGARAWFVRPVKNVAQVIGAESKRAQGDSSPAQWSPSALYFPESALNPAAAQLLSGGRWWLPSPASGNRLDLGTRFFGYRYRDGDTGFIAIWTTGPARRVKLRMAQPKVATFSSIDGSDPRPRVLRDGVEVLMGELPLLIQGTEEIPVPEPALQEAVLRFEELLKNAEVRHVQADEENFFFREALASFDQNPGGSFSSLRNYFWKLNARLGSFHWIEAEASKDHTFSEPSTLAGCSAGSALTLRAPLAAKDGLGYHAEFTLSPRSKEPMELWVAARVPVDQRPSVRVMVGGQTFQLTGDPVSLYGHAFGWFKLGSVSLQGPTKIRIEVEVGEMADLAIDTLVLHPGAFVPVGVTPPDSIPFPELPIRR